jgi:hypothetical protein
VSGAAVAGAGGVAVGVRSPGLVGLVARRAAVRVAEAFARDQRLVVELNRAQERLLEANGWLTEGLSAEALQEFFGPGGPGLGLSGFQPRVLEDPHPREALERVGRRIREAFYEYWCVADERRVLGVDVGEATAMLVDALVAAGWSEQQARDAGVLELSREEQA